MVWQKCMVAKVKRSMSHNGYINENMCIEFGVDTTHGLFEIKVNFDRQADEWTDENSEG